MADAAERLNDRSRPPVSPRPASMGDVLPGVCRDVDSSAVHQSGRTQEATDLPAGQRITLLDTSGAGQ